MRRIKKYLKKAFIILLFMLAAGLVSYPYVSNYLFDHRTKSTIDSVEQIAEETDDEERNTAIEDAHKYNEALVKADVQITDPFSAEIQTDSGDTMEYESMLCMTDDGIMGYVEIPCIDVKLPIFHGTDSETLKKGVGHLIGTSLPVGGNSTHTVLTGHTGLSTAKLFTDLTELEEGDIFFLSIFGEQLAYRVDQILVVLPENTKDLSIVDGKDYCTLVTCTPYGVNSHRLLVRGVRTEYEEAVEEAEKSGTKKVKSQWMREYGKALLIGIGLLIVLIILLILFRKHREQKRKSLTNSSNTQNEGKLDSKNRW